jgi:hypothetical protein
VILGNTEGITKLIQVVADGYLTAEGITATGGRQFVYAVRKGVYQNRHVQARELDCVDDAKFIAEVGERDQNAVDLVPVGLE